MENYDEKMFSELPISIANKFHLRLDHIHGSGCGCHKLSLGLPSDSEDLWNKELKLSTAGLCMGDSEFLRCLMSIRLSMYEHSLGGKS